MLLVEKENISLNKRKEKKIPPASIKLLKFKFSRQDKKRDYARGAKIFHYHLLERKKKSCNRIPFEESMFPLSVDSENSNSAEKENRRGRGIARKLRYHLLERKAGLS